MPTRSACIHRSHPRYPLALSIRDRIAPDVPRLEIDTQAATANGLSRSKSPAADTVTDAPGRTVNALPSPRLRAQSNPESRAVVHSSPPWRNATLLPLPSV